MHVLTIGNFDGGHEGHRSLLATARRVADQGGGEGVVTAVTFDPLPRVLLRPDGPEELLQTVPARRALLRELGADQVLVLQTDRALLATAPDAFIDDLRAQVAEYGTVGCFVEGADFRFGGDRIGTVASLKAHGARVGFEVHVVPDVRVRLSDGSEVEARSSVVRRLLAEGRVDDAAIVLGRRYSLEGTVEQGDQRGRDLGFPTANLPVGGCMLPADGIYAGVARLPDGTRRLAAVSIGSKPTFGGSERVLEAHLLDWNAALDEYGWVMNVELARFLRGQVNYDGVEPLVAQIKQDCEAVRAVEKDMELMG